MDSDAPASRPGTVLVVDDDDELLLVVERRLHQAGLQVHSVADAPAAVRALEAADDAIDVLLTDLHLPGPDGFDLLTLVRERFPGLVTVMMTGRATIATAVEAMRRGVFDYLVKPFEPPETLVNAVLRAVAHKRLKDRNRYLERELRLTQQLDGFVGSAKPVEDLLWLVDAVAPTDATVLVLGESGTGKELVARAIHRRSSRSERPFIAINCSALTESVLESELFGHVRGAFTGAVAARRGLFEEASGGTLFLDEVAELTPPTQVRLLRVLQEGEIRPVGSNESRRVDVRVVAATHRDLPRLVQEQSFRQDLYYRLNVVSLRLPPLRERLSDLPALAHHFVRKHAARLGQPPPELEVETLEALSRYGWPGNVRELENVLHRAVVLAGGRSLSPLLLPRELTEDGASSPIARRALASDALGPPEQPLAVARQRFERSYLERAMRLADGNAAEAARLAGVDRSNFRKLLKRHGLLPSRSE